MNMPGYEKLLTGSFDLLRRSTSDIDSGRTSVTWSVQASAIDGRLNPLSSEERSELGQWMQSVTHKLYIKPDQDVRPDDIFRPAGQESGPAYAVQGVIERQDAVKHALVEETQPDDASNYYEA